MIWDLRSGNNINRKAIVMATTRDKVIELFDRGATAAVEMYSDVLNDVISDERFEAFNQGIEIGIENTIRALITASVREDKMIRRVTKILGPFKERFISENWLGKAKYCY